jgi:hypothetical protein
MKTGWRRTLLGITLTVGAVLVAASPAAAAPPANDDFDNAVALTAVPFEVTADTTEATRADDDPECIGGDGFTVWYDLTLGSTTEVVLDTFGSDYDTTLSAWTGARGSLEPVACNDDSGSLQSRIRFTVQAGVTYHVMVGASAAAATRGDAELERHRHLLRRRRHQWHGDLFPTGRRGRGRHAASAGRERGHRRVVPGPRELHRLDGVAGDRAGRDGHVPSRLRGRRRGDRVPRPASTGDRAGAGDRHHSVALTTAE